MAVAGTTHRTDLVKAADDLIQYTSAATDVDVTIVDPRGPDSGVMRPVAVIFTAGTWVMNMSSGEVRTFVVASTELTIVCAGFLSIDATTTDDQTCIALYTY